MTFNIENVRRDIDMIASGRISRASVQALAEMKESLHKTYQELEGKRDKLEADLLLGTAIKLAKDESERILVRQIYSAVKVNKEYDHPFFLARLISITKNPNLVTIIPENNTAVVTLNMNQVAGDLEDYAMAVEAARSELRQTSRQRNDPVLGSHFWKEKLYGAAREGVIVIRRKKKRNYKNKTSTVTAVDVTAQYIEKYWQTMRNRMSASGSIAPFWELLDKGSLPMGSDWGGTPYPVNSQTNFVEKSCQEIRKYYERKLNDLRSHDPQFQQYVQDLINIDMELIKINRIINSFDERMESAIEGRYEIALKAIKDSLTSEQLIRASMERIEELAMHAAMTGIIQYGKQARSRLGGGVSLRTAKINRDISIHFIEGGIGF